MIHQTNHSSGYESHEMQSNEIFKTAFYKSNFGMALLNSNRHLIAVNEKMCEYLGRSESELMSTNLASLSCDDNQKSLETIISELMEGTGKDTVEFSFRRMDGTCIWLNLHLKNTSNLQNINDSIVLLSAQEVTRIKAVESDFSQVRELLRETIHITSVPTCISEYDTGKFIDVNEAFCKFSGYSRIELIGKTSIELGLYSDNRVRSDWTRRIPVGGNLKNYTLEFITKNGDRHRGLLSSHRYEFRSGDYLLSSILDVTELLILTNEIKQKDQIFDAILGKAGIGIIQLDGNGLIEKFNRHSLRLLNREGIDLVNRSFSEFLNESNKHQWLKNLADIDAGAIDQCSVVQQCTTHTGETKWFRATAIKFKGIKGSRKRTLVYLEDISLWKKNEQIQTMNETKLKFLVSHSSEPIFIIQSGKILYANTVFQQLIGYSNAELVGKAAEDLIHCMDRESLMEFNWNEIPESVPQHFPDVALFTKSGKTYNGHLVALTMTWREQPARVNFFYDTELNNNAEATKAILKAALDQCPAGIIVKSNSGQTLSMINSVALEILYPVDIIESIQKSRMYPRNWQVYRPNGTLVDYSEQPLEKVLQTGISRKNVELKIQRIDGTHKWISCNTAPVVNRSGRQIAGILVFDDITERKLQEQLIQRFLDRQISINDLTMSLGHLTTLKELYFRLYTQVARHFDIRDFLIYRWSHDNPSPKLEYMILDGNYYENVDPQMDSSLNFFQNHLGDISTKKPKPFYDSSERGPYIGLPMDTGNNSRTIITIVFNTLPEHFMEVRDFLASISNYIAIAIRNADLYNETRQHMSEIQEIIDTFPDATLKLDNRNNVTLMNSSAYQLMNLFEEFKQGNPLNSLNGLTIEELCQQTKSGAWLELDVDTQSLQVTVKSIRNNNKLMIIRNTTHQKQFKEHILKQDRLATIGRLASGIAHDFGNIMSSIVLSSQLPETTPLNSSEAMRRFSIVRQQALHASSLIRQLLNFGRRSNVPKNPINIIPLLKEQVSLLRRTFPESIQIDFVCRQTDIFINADPTSIQQAVMNLAINAKDAADSEGKIIFAISQPTNNEEISSVRPNLPDGQWVCIEVTDHGQGIPPTILPDVFEPFFSTKSSTHGTGLGLAQVDNIIAQHDGYIDVESREGQWTTFTIYLPVIDKPDSLSEVESDFKNLKSGDGELILVVEDERSTRDALSRGLEQLNYNVITASNGKEALIILDELNISPAIMISDIVMPEMGGIELCRTLESRSKKIPIFFLTGHSLDELADQIETNTHKILTKPLNLKELSDAIALRLAKGHVQSDY